MRVVGAELRDHLDERKLKAALAELDAQIGADRRVDVVFDCRPMTGYDLAARHAFVDWHQRNKPRVRRVAILTSNRVWWMVISTMSLAAGTPMKGFAQEDEANAWLAAP
ncbi:MAG TPA: STAS/SEC14 domain-containing protein [Minicystis sp.]|nr:STAS/SEC14 domain-containing protein [Minicystis sp.]